MKVLFLAFEFPPLASGGVHRAVKLAKYLSELGVSLEVVTLKPEDYSILTQVPLDPSLMKEIPDSVVVHRISSGFPDWYWKLTRNRFGSWISKYFFLGDPISFFWRGPLFEKMDGLFKKGRFDVLMSTVPPFGVSILAKKIASRYRIPWVADWRDPWTLWVNAPFTTYFHYRYAKYQEGRCLKKANVSVCTSPVTREDWLKEFKGVQADRLKVIYNGFDPSDLTVKNQQKQDGGKVRIVHVGSFYYSPKLRHSVLTPWYKKPLHRWLNYVKRKEDWLYRSPYFFLKGLKRFADTDPSLAEKIEVIFAGSIPDWLPQMLQETGTAGWVELLGPVSHSRSFELQADADAVLLTSAKVENGLDYSIAGKLYEYLGLKKKILAVVSKGAMKDMVDRSGLGLIVDPDDVNAVAGAIKRLVVKNGFIPLWDESREKFVESLNAKSTAQQMSAELQFAVNEGYRR